MTIDFYAIGADPDYNDVLHDPDEFLFNDKIENSPRHFLIENLPEFQIKLDGFTYDFSNYWQGENNEYSLMNTDYAYISVLGEYYYFFVAWDFLTTGTIRATFTPDLFEICSQWAKERSFDVLPGVYVTRRYSGTMTTPQVYDAGDPGQVIGVAKQQACFSTQDNGYVWICLFEGKVGSSNTNQFTSWCISGTAWTPAAFFGSIPQVHDFKIAVAGITTNYTNQYLRKVYCVPSVLVSKNSDYSVSSDSHPEINTAAFIPVYTPATFTASPVISANTFGRRYFCGLPGHMEEIQNGQTGTLSVTGFDGTGSMQIILYLKGRAIDFSQDMEMPVVTELTTQDVILSKIGAMVGLGSSVVGLANGNLASAGGVLTSGASLLQNYRCNVEGGNALVNFYFPNTTNPTRMFALYEMHCERSKQINMESRQLGFFQNATLSAVPESAAPSYWHANFLAIQADVFYFESPFPFPRWREILNRGVRIWYGAHYKGL